jgi:hypothetical protein
MPQKIRRAWQARDHSVNSRSTLISGRHQRSLSSPLTPKAASRLAANCGHSACSANRRLWVHFRTLSQGPALGGAPPPAEHWFMGTRPNLIDRDPGIEGRLGRSLCRRQGVLWRPGSEYAHVPASARRPFMQEVRVFPGVLSKYANVLCQSTVGRRTRAEEHASVTINQHRHILNGVHVRPALRCRTGRNPN